jgi:Autotransporter beta-domain
MLKASTILLFRAAFVTLLVAVFTVVSTSASRADNVPGSATEAIGYIAEAGTDALINGIQGDVRKLRGDDRQNTGLAFLEPQFSTMGGAVDAAAFDGIVTTDGGLSVIGSLSYRNILEEDELDYDLFTGSLLLGYRVNSQTLVFGGLITEKGDGVTPPDQGTIAHTAFGGVIGVDYTVSEKFFLTAMAGQMGLDYDITRSDGAITASFGANRRFVNLSGEYRMANEQMTTIITSGLRYMEQDNDAYTESGGAFVDAASGETFSALIGTRTTYTLGRSMQPFFETDIRYDLSQDLAWPADLGYLSDSNFQGRLGIGFSRDTEFSTFEAGIGSNFGDEGYNGLDAKMRLTLRF